MVNLIYDGQCGFCVRALRVCRALDVRHALRLHDATARAKICARFPELAHADFDNAMFAVTADRRVSRGFFAFRQVAWQSPLTWILLPILYFPGSSWIGPKVYAWIARNRHRFDCESDVCELPAPPREPRP